MTLVFRALTAMFVAAITSACGNNGIVTPQCAEFDPTFRIQVRDSLTNFPIAEQVRGAAVSPTETVRLVPRDSVLLTDSVATGAHGLFTVSLTAQGYEPWAVQNAAVTASGCAVSTFAMTARLQVAGPPTVLQPVFEQTMVDTGYAGSTRAFVNTFAGELSVTGWTHQVDSCQSLIVNATKLGYQLRVESLLAPRGTNCQPRDQWIRYTRRYSIPTGRVHVLVRDVSTGVTAADTVVNIP